MDYKFKILSKKNVNEIIFLVDKLNENKIPKNILAERQKEMFSQNYECIGIFNRTKLIGVVGLWFQMRLYSGRSCELDHVYILPEHRRFGIGSKLISFVEEHVYNKGFECLELNTYLQNTLSHKFYYNNGFKILGFHFIKHIDI